MPTEFLVNLAMPIVKSEVSSTEIAHLPDNDCDPFPVEFGDAFEACWNRSAGTQFLDRQSCKCPLATDRHTVAQSWLT